MNVLNDLFAGLTPAPATSAVTHTHLKMVPLAIPLMPHQVRSVRHVLRDTVEHGYAYCAIEMGGGKTAVGMAIAAAASAVHAGPTLVIVPPTLRIQWQREFKVFAPWLKVVVLRGEAKRMPEADVMILGDATLGSRGKLPVIKKGAKHDPMDLLSDWGKLIIGKVANLIVDESHRFKNKSRRTSALLALASVVPGVRLLMSGTPTPNGRHSELASQIDVLGDRAWKDIGGISNFYYRYAPSTDQFGGRGSDNADELFTAMSSTWYDRVLRKDVLKDLPNKGRNPVAIEGADKANKVVKDYKEAEEDLIEYLRDRGMSTVGAAKAEALVKLTTMRKLAGQAKVLNGIKHIKDILDEQPGGVFVVAEHRDVIHDLAMGLIKYNPTIVQGGMSDKDKQSNIDDFCSGKSRVMIGQVNAAGVGLTLHGDGKNHRVVVVQLPWTPADLLQAEDRLYRIGQTEDVLVEVMLCAIEGTWTIDERLWGQLETKYFRSTAINNGHGEWLLNEVVDSILDSYK